MEIVKIVDIGKSHYVAIPAGICRALSLKRGDKLVCFLYEHDNIVFKRVDDKLKELVNLDSSQNE